MIFFTFDEFYDVPMYNSFINSAKNNGINFSEWINIRPPYNWYLAIENAKDVPRYLDFKIATDNEERFMIKKIDPLKTDDEYLLLRRATDPISKVDKFIVNDFWKDAKDNGYMSLFRYGNKADLYNMTKAPEMQDTKVYMIGNLRGWNFAICSNKFVEGHIKSGWLLYTATSKELEDVPNLEAWINWNVIKTDKISRKHFITDYVMNGAYYPAKVTSGYTK